MGMCSVAVACFDAADGRMFGMLLGLVHRSRRRRRRWHGTPLFGISPRSAVLFHFWLLLRWLHPLL